MPQSPTLTPALAPHLAPATCPATAPRLPAHHAFPLRRPCASVPHLAPATCIRPCSSTGSSQARMRWSTCACMAAVVQVEVRVGRWLRMQCAWQQWRGGDVPAHGSRMEGAGGWELRDGRRHSSPSAHGLTQKICQTPVPHLSHTSPTPLPHLPGVICSTMRGSGAAWRGRRH